MKKTILGKNFNVFMLGYATCALLQDVVNIFKGRLLPDKAVSTIMIDVLLLMIWILLINQEKGNKSNG